MSHVAAEVGIGAQLLRRWVQLAAAASDAGGDLGLDVDEWAELMQRRSWQRRPAPESTGNPARTMGPRSRLLAIG